MKCDEDRRARRLDRPLHDGLDVQRVLVVGHEVHSLQLLLLQGGELPCQQVEDLIRRPRKRRCRRPLEWQWFAKPVLGADVLVLAEHACRIGRIGP